MLLGRTAGDMEITGSDDTMRARWSHALGQSVAAAAVAQNLAAFSDMGIGDEGAAAFMAKREWGPGFLLKVLQWSPGGFAAAVQNWLLKVLMDALSGVRGGGICYIHQRPVWPPNPSS